MFKAMRRSERQLSKEEALRILEKGDYGTLSTWNGRYPYCVPVNYIFLDGSIYFHTALEGHKIENIKNYPLVSFSVVTKSIINPRELSTRYESVIAFGKAELITDEEEKKRILRNLVKKFAPDYESLGEECISSTLKQTGIVRISIEHITAKANRG
ncbi:MAG: uncharacterized protein PWQ20_1879 [Thermotogaceae bacterium]|jgi:hypothetical protein|nr:uncharacterized protein [Thermotogaceae bacterium]MDN5338809.1 uncharacterized protein [Thermotogaceae bacterium]